MPLRNLRFFPAFLLNICGLATFIFDPVLDQRAFATTITFTSSIANSAWICAHIATSCSYCY